jgi:oligopeptide transport system substrate-binding protein
VLILRNPLTASFAAVLAAGALIAGCGGDDDDDGGSAGGAGGNSQTLRMALGAEPPSLDPGLATDITSFYVIQALMDPLVQLDDELEPAPAIAESWEVTDDGKTVTFALRDDASWTNGDPVTAGDFEYAWKRAIAPETAAGYAYQFFGISGAAEFNGCDSAKADCAALRDEVGVSALDDRTLEVKLTSSQPWFVAQAAHLSFLPVHRATVERFGEKWTEPKTIVTNGPFRLTKWNHDELLTLERWPDWRESDTVPLERIQMKIIPQATTAIQAFEAGEIDVCLEQPTCIPIGDFDRVKETPEFDEFPALLTTYLGVNVKNVPLEVRRALALAIDRTALIENVTHTGTPATSFTPKGMPGFEEIVQDFISPEADLERARAELGNAKPGRLTVFAPSDELSRETLVAIQAMWRELGIESEIKTQEWAQFLEFLGPPPNDAVDLFNIGWIGDYVDDINFLELWTCGSGNNPTNYCDPAYDRIIDEARSTPEDAARHELYARAEAMLTGPEGAFPLIPLGWATAPILRRETVHGLELNLLGQFDWTKISIGGSD